MTALKVEHLLDVPVRELSGGDRRRVELAVAMFRAPTCLLVDEPFRGVDPLSAELIGSALRDMANGGCAVMLTGHEVETLMQYVGNVVWMTSGTTYDLGTPATARENERFRREYLGLSTTRINDLE